MLVSVIIPTLNRCRLLNRTLFSLFEQETAHPFEIIVVDNGSGDETREIVERYRDSGRRRVSYRFDDRPGLLIGRNVGAHLASGAILSFIDDDVVLPPFWIDAIANVFQDEQVHLATGNNYPFFESPPPEWVDGLWRRHGSTSYLYELSLLDAGQRRMPIEPFFVWGLNYHIRKKVYFDVGGFNPDILSADYKFFIGDGETGIADRIAARGYKACFDPGLSLYHTVTSERLTREYFLRRSYTEGMMQAYTDLRHGGGERSSGKRWEWLRLPVRAGRKILQTVAWNRESNPEVTRLQEEIKGSLARGYRDYLENFEGNALLGEYVQEKDYLDLDYISGKYYRKAGRAAGSATEMA